MRSGPLRLRYGQEAFGGERGTRTLDLGIMREIAADQLLSYHQYVAFKLH